MVLLDLRSVSWSVVFRGDGDFCIGSDGLLSGLWFGFTNNGGVRVSAGVLAGDKVGADRGGVTLSCGCCSSRLGNSNSSSFKWSA